MLSIKLPIKVLKDVNSIVEKEALEYEIDCILSEWLVDHPKVKVNSHDIVWGSYYDIVGKELPNGSSDWLDLYKAIKKFLWSNKNR